MTKFLRPPDQHRPDYRGSSTVITDHTGNVVQRLSYTPFGSFQGPAPTDGAALHHFFTGQELDQSTDLYHLGARYYDPALGRFTQPDPITQDVYDPQSLNPYSYARNNPLRLIDPTGLSWQDTWNSWSAGVTQGWQSFTGWASQTWQSTTTFFSQPFQTATTFLGQSLNAATTTAMQSFTQLASLGQSASQTWTGLTQGGGPFFDASQGFRQTSYRETFTAAGVTQTFQTSSFTPLARSALPPELLLASFQAGLQQVGTFTQPVAGFLLADPGRLLGIATSLLPESAAKDVLRVTDVVLYTGGPFEKTGAIVVGGFTGELGRVAFTAINPALAPVGGVVGSLTGGYLGAQAGGVIDSIFGLSR